MTGSPTHQVSSPITWLKLHEAHDKFGWCGKSTVDCDLDCLVVVHDVQAYIIYGSAADETYPPGYDLFPYLNQCFL